MIPLDCFSRNENLILRKLQTEEDEENNRTEDEKKIKLYKTRRLPYQGRLVFSLLWETKLMKEEK